MLMADECVGHMTEKVVIPPASEIEVENRKYYNGPADDYFPFKRDSSLVPPIVKPGDGYGLYITGLAHDEKGYPIFHHDIRKSTTRALVDKIRLNADEIIEVEEDSLDDAEVVVVSYGISSRVALRAIELARKEGIKVGTLRLITVWPFPEKKIEELSKKVKGFVVPEINYGQIAFEVERCSRGNANVILVPHGGASVHIPEDILGAIRQVAKDTKQYPQLVSYKTSLEKQIFG